LSKKKRVNKFSPDGKYPHQQHHIEAGQPNGAQNKKEED